MRKNSFSTNALRNVLEIISAKYKTEARLLNLLETELPIYRPSNRSENENVIKVTRDVNWANVFVLASPDYHGSMSGTMKNFLDFFWKEFSGKTFGYIVSSHEKGLTVMDQMRTAVRQCYAWSLPYGISINESEDLDSNGLSSKQEITVTNGNACQGFGCLRWFNLLAIYEGQEFIRTQYLRTLLPLDQTSKLESVGLKFSWTELRKRLDY